MSKEPRVHELITLKTIAETLNQPGELAPMLTLVLDKLLELTGLASGWIFLADGQSDYMLAADCGLPPALLHLNRQPMRTGRCWCMDRYRDGKLNNAVNIMSCKRLEDAVAYRSGDTRGITHHATVPLRSGSRKVGVLNVAAPGKEKFSDEELALLQSVAFQIGGAVERMRLYSAEQRRADLFERLGNFSRSLRVATMSHAGSAALGEQAIALIAAQFEWKFAAIMERVGDDFIVRASHARGRVCIEPSQLRPEGAAWLRRIGEKRRLARASGKEAAAVVEQRNREQPPLSLAAIAAVHVPNSGLSLPWVIIVGDEEESGHADIENEALKALGEHFAVALDSVCLEANRRELARLDERNRIARDLHDSVCQMLFSLSMTAKGTESLLAPAGDGEERKTEAALLAVQDMQALSQQALKEMRELIMQLRPAGLETGLVAALSMYGDKLGLQIRSQLSGVREIPGLIEEALWRIGQEALNNVRKHAGVSAADVSLELEDNRAILRIADNGCGMGGAGERARQDSIGLASMRERTEALGGRFKAIGAGRKGTIVEAAIPLPAPNYSS